MLRRARVALILAGAIPIAMALLQPPDLLLLIFTLFVLAVLLRRRLKDLASRIPFGPSLTLFMFVILSGILTETLLWTTGRISGGAGSPAIDVSLPAHVASVIGIYASWGLAWWLTLRRWRFTVAQVFLVQGIYGILVEQQGAILVQGLQSFPLGLIWWVYVFLVYGSAMGLAYLPLEASFGDLARREGWLKIPAALALNLAALLVIGLAWEIALAAIRSFA